MNIGAILGRHRLWISVGAHRQASSDNARGVAGAAGHSVLGVRHQRRWSWRIGAFLMQVSVQGAWGIIPVHLNELSPPGNSRNFPRGSSISSAISSRREICPSRSLIAEAHGNNYGLAMASVVGTVAVIIILMVAWGPERRGVAMADAQREPHLRNRPRSARRRARSRKRVCSRRLSRAGRASINNQRLAIRARGLNGNAVPVHRSGGRQRFILHILPRLPPGTASRC